MAVDLATRTSPRRLRDHERRAWRGLLRAHAALVKSLDAELEAAHGIGLTTYEVLVHLSDAPRCQMRMCDLASTVLLSRSGLTRLVDRLERDGLLERLSCTHDARGAYAVLTASGRAKLRAASSTHLAGMRAHFLDRFEDEELQMLGELCERIAPSPACGPRGSRCA